MANVVLTAAAMAMIRDVARDSQFEYPALIVGRTPQSKDLVRRADGNAEWRVVDEGLWYVHIVGEPDAPSHADVTPFEELPGLALNADAATVTLVGTLTIDIRNGHLAVTSIAT
jgi:hypothetical protein